MNVLNSWVLLFLIFASCFLYSSIGQPTGRCQRSNNTCWPTDSEIADLFEKLDPNAERTLITKPFSSIFPCAIPIESAGQQPLYGGTKERTITTCSSLFKYYIYISFHILAGKSLLPLYVESEGDRNGTCFVRDFAPTYCLVSTRSNAAQLGIIIDQFYLSHFEPKLI